MQQLITGQTALSGSVDTGNDLVLLYDNSATALKKVDVSTLLASAGAGNMNSFTLTGDSGSNQTVADGNTVDIAGGTGIDTVVGATDTVTVNIDSSVATLTGSQTLTNKTLTSPVLNTGVSGTAIKDEDNMSSDSATHLATQQSIKTYVDTETGASLITGQTTETSINDADLVLIYDDSASALRKMTKTNFVSGLSSGGGSADKDKKKTTRSRSY